MVLHSDALVRSTERIINVCGKSPIICQGENHEHQSWYFHSLSIDGRHARERSDFRRPVVHIDIE